MVPCRTALILTLAAFQVLACEAAGPSRTIVDGALHFTGQVRLQGAPPDPSTLVWSDAYSTALPRGFFTDTLQLDPTGAFVGAFPPIPYNRIDSLVLFATQPTCDGSPTTSLWYGGYGVSSETLRLPTLNLQYPQPPAGLQAGLEMCGALRLAGSSSSTSWVSLIIDSLADSAFGRYAIGHNQTVASDQGQFAGQVSDSLLALRFASEHYPPCTGVSLAIPLIHQDSFGLATLTGAAEDFCGITSGQLRLFPHHYGFPRLLQRIDARHP